MANLSRRERREANDMLNELELAEFSVVLIPADEPKHSGHSLRALESGNPKWYSELCSSYTSCRGRKRKKMRRARTYIHKKTTLRALRRILAGDLTGTYAERLLPIIRDRANGKRIPVTSTIDEPYITPDGREIYLLF